MATWKKLVQFNSGDTITVSNPTANSHAATKAYVDNATTGIVWSRTNNVLEPEDTDDVVKILKGLHLSGWYTHNLSFGSAHSSHSATNTGAQMEVPLHATNGKAHGSFKFYTNSGDIRNLALTLEESGNAVFGGTATFVGEVSTSSSGGGFKVKNASTATKWTQVAYDGLYGSGSQHLYISSAGSHDIKFYPAGVLKQTFSADGSATFAGDIHSQGDLYIDQARSNWRTIQYRDTDNSNAIQAYVSAYNTSASDGFLRLNAIESLQFRTGDVERLKLTSSSATFAGSEINLGTGTQSQKNKLTTGDGIYASTNYNPDQYYLAWNYANKGGTESVGSSSRASWIWKGVTSTSGNYLELRHRAGNASAGTQNSVLKFDSSRNATFAGNIIRDKITIDTDHVLFSRNGSYSASRAWRWRVDDTAWGNFDLRRSNGEDNTIDTSVLLFDGANSNATFAGEIVASKKVTITAETSAYGIHLNSGSSGSTAPFYISHGGGSHTGGAIKIYSANSGNLFTATASSGSSTFSIGSVYNNQSPDITSSGGATFSGHINAPSQKLTNFQEIRIDDAELYFTDTANEDYWRFRRDASDNFVLDHWHTGGSAESALSFDSSKNATFSGNVNVPKLLKFTDANSSADFSVGKVTDGNDTWLNLKADSQSDIRVEGNLLVTGSIPNLGATTFSGDITISDGDPTITLKNTSSHTNNRWWTIQNGASGDGYGDLAFHKNNANNGGISSTQIFKIDKDGDATFAGQGTFNDNLSVIKSASATITIKGNAANANASLTFMEQSTTMWELRADGGASDKLSFIDTGGAEVLALGQDSSATFSGSVILSGGSAGDNTLYKHSNNYLYLLGGTAGLILKGKNSDDSFTIFNNSEQRIYHYTNNLERMVIHNDGTTIQKALAVNGISTITVSSSSNTITTVLKLVKQHDNKGDDDAGAAIDFYAENKDGGTNQITSRIAGYTSDATGGSGFEGGLRFYTVTDGYTPSEALHINHSKDATFYGKITQSMDGGNTGVVNTFRNTNDGGSAYCELHITNADQSLVVGYSDNHSSGEWDGGWVYPTAGNLMLKSHGDIELTAGGTGDEKRAIIIGTDGTTTHYGTGYVDATRFRSSANTNYYTDPDGTSALYQLEVYNGLGMNNKNITNFKQIAPHDNNNFIGPATSDGSDSGRLNLGGGGSNSLDRGAWIELFGNEYGDSRAGQVNMGASKGFVMNGVENATYALKIGTTETAGAFHIYNGGSGDNGYFGGLDQSSGTTNFSIHSDASFNSYMCRTGAKFGLGTGSPEVKLDVHSHGTEVAAVFGMADDDTVWVSTRVAETVNKYGAYAFMVGDKAVDGVGSTNTTAFMSSAVIQSGTLKGNLKFNTNAGDNLSLALTLNESQNAIFENSVYVGGGNRGSLQAYGSHDMSLHSVHSISFDWNAGYDAYMNHGIASTDNNGNNNDSVSVNSYNDINLRLDSNNNNNESYLRIMNNSTGMNQIMYSGYDGARAVHYFDGKVAIATSPDASYALKVNGHTYIANDCHVGGPIASNGHSPSSLYGLRTKTTAGDGSWAIYATNNSSSGYQGGGAYLNSDNVGMSIGYGAYVASSGASSKNYALYAGAGNVYVTNQLHVNGRIGIGVTNPTEMLVIGKDLGNMTTAVGMVFGSDTHAHFFQGYSSTNFRQQTYSVSNTGLHRAYDYVKINSQGFYTCWAEVTDHGGSVGKKGYIRYGATTETDDAWDGIKPKMVQGGTTPGFQIAGSGIMLGNSNISYSDPEDSSDYAFIYVKSGELYFRVGDGSEHKIAG